MKCNATMISVRLFFLLIVLTLLTMAQANAATYSLIPPNRPAICSGNQGFWSGNVYVCTWGQPLSVASGDRITSNTNIRILSYNGFNLTNVILGGTGYTIDLEAQGGNETRLTGSTLYGSIYGSSNNVRLMTGTVVNGSVAVTGNFQSNNATITGSVNAYNGITSINTTFGSTLTANSDIALTGGSVAGLVTSTANSLTTSGTNLNGGATTQGNMTITGGTIQGDFTFTSRNTFRLEDATFTSGTVAGGNFAYITNSIIGSPSSQLEVTVQSNDITVTNSTVYADMSSQQGNIHLNDSTVFGDLNASNVSGHYVYVNGSSQVYGNCLPVEVPAQACGGSNSSSATPYWKFDEVLWNGSNNQVLDSSVNLRHGRSRNGANTAITSPSPASCTYGDFQRGTSSSNNPYVDIGRNSYFHGADDFSFSLWIRMNGADQPGTRQVILAYGADDGVNDEDDGRFELLRTSAGALRFAVRMQNEDLRYVETVGNVFNGQWHHVAVSYSKANMRMRLYVDNVLLDNIPNQSIGNGNPAKTPNDGNRGLSIGALPNGSNGIRGQIDEVRFFTSELTAAQVAGYAAQTASCSVPEQCFLENFSNDVNWYQTNLNSTPPSLQSSPSRLRLTTNAQNQSTSITFKRSFPAAGNRLTVEFDHYAYGGNGADGISLVLSDATQVPFPGSFGGSLGYAQRDNGNQGFRGGWLGVGFDEYGNYSLANEGRVGGFIGNLRPNTIGVRGAASSNYRWLAGTATLSPILQNGASFGRGDRYRITIDSTSVPGGLFRLERRVSGQATYSTLINNQNLQSLGQAAAPANLLLSFTGSTGSNTNFHELTNVQVCSVLPSVPIEIGNPIHHFRFNYNSGVTCQSNSVEVRACLNADCSQLYTQPVSVTVAANNSASWPAGNTVNLTNGIGTLALAKTSTGSTTLSLASSSVLPANPVQCRDTGVADSSCGVQFNDAALRFSAIANQIAGVWSAETNKLQIIETIPQTGACAARVVPSATVGLGYKCVDPKSCIDGQELRVRDTSLTPNTNIAIQRNDSEDSWSYQSTPLAFASAESDFALKYTDVGKVQLKARLVLAATSTQPEVPLEALSNEFVVRPDRIVVQSVSRTDGSSNPATTNTGEGFVAAGENFKVVLDVLNRDGDRTPNFGNEDTEETLALNSVLVYPIITGAGCAEATSNCISNPAISSGAGFVADQDFAGRFETSTASWTQVGSIQLNGKIADDNYLGAGNTASTNPSVVVGRFYPHHFALSSTGSSVEDSCTAGDFSYMGSDSISVRATLEAKAADGTTVLTNYNSLPNKVYSGAASISLVAENNNAGIDLGTRVSTDSVAWIDGRRVLSSTTAVFEKLPNLTPDGPYSALQLGLRVATEIDNRNFESSALNMDATAATDCSVLTNCNAVQFGNTLDIRYGRLALINTGGPEDQDLPVTLQSQYWRGGRFERNQNDGCTGYDVANLNVTGITTLKGGASGTVVVGQNPHMDIFIPAPGVAGTAVMEYQIPPALNYLKFPWGGGVILTDPTAEAQFGRYQGNKRQIFWQERLN
ncbi:DUF6701 domain-containing protein [Rheinheimera soli]|uniref:DUF6701 domain-containing protein n=1 Tax=Rheinheimera soli TaxID=443616 RepID=UPI001E4661CA|nr:DUF6701 domain-containing protein [Rheinheimera soli]